MAGRTRLLLGLAALALFALFVVLGRWQLGRAELKQAMLAQVERALAAPERALAPVLREDAPALPVQVRAGEGGFLPVPPILLDNQVREGSNGVLVYRVWREAGAVPAVLVEQGWVPWGPARDLHALALPPAAGAPDGLLTHWPGQALALARVASPSPGEPWLVARLDRERIGEEFALALFDGVLRTGEDAAQRVRAPLLAMPPERHRGYALQWFALAAAVVIGYGVLTWKLASR